MQRFFGTERCTLRIRMGSAVAVLGPLEPSGTGCVEHEAASYLLLQKPLLQAPVLPRLGVWLNDPCRSLLTWDILWFYVAWDASNWTWLLGRSRVLLIKVLEYWGRNLHIFLPEILRFLEKSLCCIMMGCCKTLKRYFSVLISHALVIGHFSDLDYGCSYSISASVLISTSETSLFSEM